MSTHHCNSKCIVKEFATPIGFTLSSRQRDEYQDFCSLRDRRGEDSFTHYIQSPSSRVVTKIEGFYIHCYFEPELCDLKGDNCMTTFKIKERYGKKQS